jgi:hypothetical protein
MSTPFSAHLRSHLPRGPLHQGLQLTMEHEGLPRCLQTTWGTLKNAKLQVVPQSDDSRAPKLERQYFLKLPDGCSGSQGQEPLIQLDRQAHSEAVLDRGMSALAGFSEHLRRCCKLCLLF